MTTSEYSNSQLAWRISRYLMVQGVIGTFRLVRWSVVQGAWVSVGILRLIASPASSGRAHDEFQDLVKPDSPENLAASGEHSDDFWRMYFQAYTPRAWRMRRLLTTVAGRKRKKPEADEE